MNAHPTRTETINPQKLFDILDKQVNLSSELLDILAEEKEALIAMDMQALLRLSKKKEHQLARIQLHDQTMQEEGQRLLPNADGKVVKLAALTPLVTEEEDSRLQEYRDRLESMRNEILSRNIFNKQFAEDTQRYLNDAIRLITSAATEERPMYGTRGKAKPVASQPSLLSREV